jgi:hypothetical protein
VPTPIRVYTDGQIDDIDDDAGLRTAQGVRAPEAGTTRIHRREKTTGRPTCGALTRLPFHALIRTTRPINCPHCNLPDHTKRRAGI